MNTCDCCDALLSESEILANPRWDQELCDHCAAEFAAANLNRPVTNRQRMDAVHDACSVAFQLAYHAWCVSDDTSRRLWMSIQEACADELQDCVAAAKAGVP